MKDDIIVIVFMIINCWCVYEGGRSGDHTMAVLGVAFIGFHTVRLLVHRRRLTRLNKLRK